MDSIQEISDYEAIKILSDERRLAILRHLMVAPATLTHLGQALDMHPARIRYHLKLLEGSSLVALAYARKVGKYTEKYYRATARAFSIQMSILPLGADENLILASGSHDLALDLLADRLRQDPGTPAMYTLPVGSLDGLIALRQGLCQLAGCHLYDPVGGEYNTSYVRHLFPGQAMRVMTLAHRQQGLLVASGNPRQIKSLQDLLREDIRFINRKLGSGTRLWLDQQLRAMGLDATLIQGYTQEVNTHAQVARAVRDGAADTGLAVLASARKFELDFIPLFEERFDLVMTQETYHGKLLSPALETLQTARFRTAIEGLGGYDPGATGSEVLFNTIQ
jgi:putative molybdopterin biosynthesis protein